MDNYDLIITYLVKNNIATHEQIREVKQAIVKTRANFLQQILADGLVSPTQLSYINREAYNLPYVSLRELYIRRELVSQFKEEVVRKEQERIATELLNFEQDLWEY